MFLFINRICFIYSGLALANVFQTATFVPFVALLKNEFRARFNSIERICEYAKVRFKFHYNNHFIKYKIGLNWQDYISNPLFQDIEQEDSSEDKYIKSKDPNETWPKTGDVQFENVQLRYHKDGPLVLKNIDINMTSGSKIGVVGRTGAGKSSLITALLRLTELDEGKITVSGMNISEISLFNLRSAIAVIPQDPVLFQGD